MFSRTLGTGEHLTDIVIATHPVAAVLYARSTDKWIRIYRYDSYDIFFQVFPCINYICTVGQLYRRWKVQSTWVLLFRQQA